MHSDSLHKLINWEPAYSWINYTMNELLAETRVCTGVVKACVFEHVPVEGTGTLFDTISNRRLYCRRHSTLTDIMFDHYGLTLTSMETQREDGD